MKDNLDDIKQQIDYCTKQIKRFHEILKDPKISKADHYERTVQLGYSYGRKYVLDKLLPLNETKSDELLKAFDADKLDKLKKAYEVLRYEFYVNPYPTDDELYNYGYNIGLVQDFKNDSHLIWWKPIVPYIRNADWVEVVNITKKNIGV